MYRPVPLLAAEIRAVAQTRRRDSRQAGDPTCQQKHPNIQRKTTNAACAGDSAGHVFTVQELGLVNWPLTLNFQYLCATLTPVLRGSILYEVSVHILEVYIYIYHLSTVIYIDGVRHIEQLRNGVGFNIHLFIRAKKTLSHIIRRSPFVLRWRFVHRQG